MKIKNTQTFLSAEPGKARRQQQLKKNNNNKENQMLSANRAQPKGCEKQKSTFGEDITKKSNEPGFKSNDFTLSEQGSSVSLPDFLTKRTSFTIQIEPYVNSIIEYMVGSHNSREFTQKFRSSIKSKKSSRRAIVGKLYILFKEYKLRRKTLYLAIYYFDKYIRLTNERDLSKLVQISEACMLISMKYEEIYPPSLEKWAKGRERTIILWESKILKLLDFNLAYSTPQHYLEIYQGKNPYMARQECKLHEILLDLHLFAGCTYDEHPLKLVQLIVESFRSTAFMEKNTVYEESDQIVKEMIINNEQTWSFLLQTQIKYKR